MDLLDIKTKTDEEILDAYAIVGSRLKELMHEDMMVAVTNTTRPIHFFPGYEIGHYTPDEGSDVSTLSPEFTQCMQTGRSSVVITKQLNGLPFMSMTSPISNGSGKAIGCFSIGRSYEKMAKIEESSQDLAATLQEVNAGLQEVASGSAGLSNTIHSVVESANESAVKINEINRVIGAITDISSHSNLLGLNAAIEAARAGEQGRGFAVVAEEMRKLAAQSKDSAVMVTDILTEMKSSIEKIINDINQIGSIAENQAAATQEITASIEGISDNSLKLVELTKYKVDN
ncbi:methyl-accepting chemotaxis protein [Dehalobacter sp. DCM]|uniref:methyl-accepting chemotaxis protein n=1 Tax=Dehalobacter sp. DCM TaxID=2907827 RepID=UPI003081FF69|nr:methyl-accepting chemotaxis protein [Dehalobacter sp. DCM]